MLYAIINGCASDYAIFSKIMVKRYLYDNFTGLFMKYFCILYANITPVVMPIFSKIMVKIIYKFDFRGLFMKRFGIIHASINDCDWGYTIVSKIA
jgi:hypothetical protein